jgi:hypothetical protein
VRVGVIAKSTRIISKFDLEVYAVVFWAVKTWSLLYGYQHFEKKYVPLIFSVDLLFNPLNAKLNSICQLLAFLGARHILHVSRIRVKMKAVYASEMSMSTYLKDYFVEDHNFNI